MLQKEYNIRQIPGFVQGFGLFIGKKELQDRRFITTPYLLCNFPKYPLVQIETVVHEI